MQTDLLAVEIGEKQSRSIQCQMTVAKLPLSKELEKFAFNAAQVDETLVGLWGVGLTCHAPACCNLAVLSLFRSCLRAFGEVLLIILLALAGFCQRNQRSAAVAGVRRTGWKGYSRPQNAAR